MNRTDSFIGPDAFALRMAVIGFSATIAAVVILLLFVTPADRGGGPILADKIRPIIQKLGLPFGSRQLAGQNAFADTKTIVSLKPRFIVRFDEASPLQQSVRVYRENRTKGKEAFKSVAATLEGMSAFSLAAVTPAGEVVLTYENTVQGDLAEDIVTDIAEALRATSGVIMVDPYSIYPVARSE